MRGIITLAAALALPHDGTEFPYRDLILVTAFAVVIGTLVLQGLTLKPLIRVLRLRDDDPVGRETDFARRARARGRARDPRRRFLAGGGGSSPGARRAPEPRRRGREENGRPGLLARRDPRARPGRGPADRPRDARSGRDRRRRLPSPRRAARLGGVGSRSGTGGLTPGSTTRRVELVPRDARPPEMHGRIGAPRPPAFGGAGDVVQRRIVRGEGVGTPERPQRDVLRGRFAETRHAQE